MPDMLEQAIVDAKQLREAAVKAGEKALIEKYTPEIKEAVRVLLEQPAPDEDLFGDEEDDLGIGGLGGEEDIDLGPDLGPDPMAGDEAPVDVGLDLPASFSGGEKLCDCPSDKEEVEIDFDQLKAEMDKEAEMSGTAPGREESPLADEEEEEEIELVESDLRAIIGEADEDLEDLEESDDQEDIDESLHVDQRVVPSGQIAPHGPAVPGAKLDHARDQALAAVSDDETEEENKELQKALKDLETIKEHKNVLEKRNKRYLELIKAMADKVEATNLSNARLLYTNRALNSTSLNERQKQRIVEAISSAGSIKEAKMLYESLRDAVGSTKKEKLPESLHEAISKKRTTPFVRRSRKETADPVAEAAKNRWQKLAGIKTE